MAALHACKATTHAASIFTLRELLLPRAASVHLIPDAPIIKEAPAVLKLHSAAYASRVRLRRTLGALSWLDVHMNARL